MFPLIMGNETSYKVLGQSVTLSATEAMESGLVQNIFPSEELMPFAEKFCLELADKRDAETWQKHWEELVTAGVITKPRVVSDQGSGLVKGCQLMGLKPDPDLFHLLHPLTAV